MKKLFMLMAIFALIFVSCGGDDSLDKDKGDNGNTTLKIQNESFSDITDVRWSNILFVQDTESITNGSHVTKNVQEGSGYIYFKRKTKSINARTKELVVVEKNEQKSFTINDNTIIVDVDNTANEGTFGVLGVNTSYSIGDTGPGGGKIFFAEGGQYKEVSGELGNYNWTDAKTIAQNYKGGGFTNWHLPDNGELDLMYQNLHEKGIGGFLETYYWSSTEYTSSTFAYALTFYNGSLNNLANKSYVYQVRAVRSFNF